LYLEDLYVRPEYRGRGYGKRLLSRLAQVALEDDCGRIEWAVLGWNESAVRFYESIGAVEVEGWKLFRLTASGINELAAST
jgi:GNAT superfamily N-acetyltransferase